ncbi:hypothetical protein TUBRATIS_12250 [Tubulinosema ratisbonensis]|uniref:Uncharacterized protein n=1 Tax=Tubulinosema ratisbonensis TaxID=291195 RepID=A0A437AMA6_9MICR|nr:hypothetical protein TUBRATIS_12250 [Tubulinosema ratisbonensis]
MGLTWIVLFRFPEYLCTTPTKIVSKIVEDKNKTSEEENETKTQIPSRRPDNQNLRQKIKNLETKYQNLQEQNKELLDKFHDKDIYILKTKFSLYLELKERVENEKIKYEKFLQEGDKTDMQELCFFYTRINQLKRDRNLLLELPEVDN